MYYKDIDITLEKAKDGDIKHDEDEDAVSNSISNIVQTIMGSRVMLPGFAMNGNELLFEPLSEEVANQLAAMIWDAIEFWDPRVNLDNMNINIDYDNHYYETTITFSIREITEQVEQVTIVLHKL